MDDRKTIAEIYDCAVLWRSDDADHPNTPPKAWQKVLPLMEAAPDLLEALENYVNWLDDDVYPSDETMTRLHKAAKQAIKEARGE